MRKLEFESISEQVYHGWPLELESKLDFPTLETAIYAIPFVEPKGLKKAPLLPLGTNVFLHDLGLVYILPPFFPPHSCS